MKSVLPILLLFLTSTVWGQEKVKPTEAFTVSGKIKTELTFTLSDISRYDKQNIGNLILTNQRGETKDTAKNLKGILLKDILSNLEFQVEKPKELNEFFLICIAIDGYKIVYSWNELFNSETGNHVYLITEKDGKKIGDIPERMLLLSTSDFKTGRRYLKGLQKISIARAD